MTLLGNWLNLFLGLEVTELVLENLTLLGLIVLLGVSQNGLMEILIMITVIHLQQQ